jgi:uncharacterized protein
MGRRPAARKRSGPSRGAVRADEGDRLVSLDLRSLDLVPGTARALDVEIPVAPLRIGGEDYIADPAAPPVRLDVVRLGKGWHFRMRSTLHVAGPCWRCLEDAHPAVAIDVTEVSIEGADDPEMVSLYLEQGVLDVADWARDAVAEALPPTILCDEQCAGLCTICGANLNHGDCGCGAGSVDPRWSALAELAERLRGPGVGPDPEDAT